MTYREKQLQEENEMLYWNLVWLQYVTGQHNNDGLIDEDSDKEYGFIKYKDIQVVNFPTRRETELEMKLFENNVIS